MLSSALKESARLSRKAALSQGVLSRGFAKEIKFGVEGRAAMLRGVDTLADAVQVRLDPCRIDLSPKTCLMRPDGKTFAVEDLF
jgi:hypothetical protein